VANESDSAFSAEVAAITTAFGDPTRRAAWLYARAAGETGVTAGDVADRLSLHPNVARHHLDKLAASTYLEVFVELPAGQASRAAGRPAKRYRVPAEVAVEGQALEFPARRDDLLITLLGRALALLDRDEAEAMAEDVGLQYGRELAAAMAGSDAHRSFQAALHAIADALTAHGFAAHAEARGGSIAVIAEHCPFGEAANQHPVMCAVDRGMVKGMLAGLGVERDHDPATESSRALGDEACVTLV
jgi:predicted ArsR family transcriptional regulator